MEEKIDKDLLIELRSRKGPFRVSIQGVSQKLDDLVCVNRYEGMSDERLRLIGEETKIMLTPICACLDGYGLVLGKDYVSDEVLRNVSALLSSDKVFDLASRDYVKKISRNFQRGLPF